MGTGVFDWGRIADCGIADVGCEMWDLGIEDFALRLRPPDYLS